MEENVKGEVVQIEDLKLPPILYKYRCFGDAFHEKTLYNQEIYIPSADEFNDPYESKIPFRYIEADLTDENIIKKANEIGKILFPFDSEKADEHAYLVHRDGILTNADYLETFDNATYEKLCSDFGIFSLTPNCNDVLMWSYYANSHKGFCVGYDTSYLVKCGLFGMGGEVLYSEEFPKMPLFRKDDDKTLLKILFTKWPKWKHEGEYRLIHKFAKGDVFQLPKEAIMEVVFGCRVVEPKKVEVVSKIRELLPKTQIFQIALNKQMFELQKLAVFDDRLLINS